MCRWLWIPASGSKHLTQMNTDQIGIRPDDLSAATVRASPQAVFIAFNGSSRDAGRLHPRLNPGTEPNSPCGFIMRCAGWTHGQRQRSGHPALSLLICVYLRSILTCCGGSRTRSSGHARTMPNAAFRIFRGVVALRPPVPTPPPSARAGGIRIFPGPGKWRWRFNSRQLAKPPMETVCPAAKMRKVEPRTAAV